MKKMKLQSKMILVIASLLLFAALAEALFFSREISTILENQIGKRALQVSKIVAELPEVKEGLLSGDFHNPKIQELAESVRRQTEAEFIVIGDKDGRRFSHPIKKRIGEFMVGGDNSLGLEEGLSYISKAKGSLGLSIRGKTPVFDNGKVIGIVSVGYLMEDVQTIIGRYQIKIYLVLAAIFLVGIFFTVKITSDLKKAIFGLEPEEIATLLQEKTATLEAVREGIIAIDNKGFVTTVNHAAIETLALETKGGIIGEDVRGVFPATRMFEVLKSGKSQLDQILHHNGRDIIVNRIPINIGEKITGVVCSFRDKSELEEISRELLSVQQYSEVLRAKSHEYANKLHTIAGLIQIGAYDKVLTLIGNEISGYQELIDSLMEITSDPVIAGTILGKYSKATDLKIKMVVDPDSSMRDIPDAIDRGELVTILGNIFDNALEAVARKESGRKEVHFSMTDLGNDLIFDFDDSGEGVAPEMYQQIFAKGYTVKEEAGHGMGLYLVEETIKQLGGTITVGVSELGGMAFTVILPKKSV